MTKNIFPLQGIIGIVGNHPNEVDMAVDCNLKCVEVRSDLLINAGFSVDQVLEIVASARQKELGCLVTHRRVDHGGKFSGSEQDRVDFCLRAVAAGAQIIDAEWDSESGEKLIAEGVPTILSYHDFHGMTEAAELQHITDIMLAKQPAALKVVPTASCIADSARMLHWVADRNDGPVRIGFAMGAAGEISRVITLKAGAPITYASFGQSVAPGQISIEDLQSLYQIEGLNPGQ